MTLSQENDQQMANKKHLFEYLVYQLEQWRKDKHPEKADAFTKLKLQKILFLVASVNAKKDDHPLLDVFNNFYALPYGPVEIDIYEAMNDKSFRNINFEGNECKQNFEENVFEDLDTRLTEAIKNSIQAIREKGADYIIMSPFELVDITHKWTSWQVAMQVAEMCNSKRERMSTDDIISSTVKAYK